MAQQRVKSSSTPQKGGQARKPKKRGRLLAILLVALFLITLVPIPVYSFIQTAMYPTTYNEYVEKWADVFSVDPYLVYAVIRTESSFKPDAQSAAGARGLMQMTEDTFEWIKPQISPGQEVGFEDLYDPETSIQFGVYLLNYCLKRYDGDISTAAAAYHSGINAVDTLLENSEYSADGVVLTAFPYDQMNHYVSKINKNYEKYISLYR